jgi:hypothetical protein
MTASAVDGEPPYLLPPRRVICGSRVSRLSQKPAATGAVMRQACDDSVVANVALYRTELHPRKLVMILAAQQTPDQQGWLQCGTFPQNKLTPEVVSES